jgi:hypothetical protein
LRIPGDGRTAAARASPVHLGHTAHPRRRHRAREAGHQALHPRLVYDDMLHDEIVACLGTDHERALKTCKEWPPFLRPSEFAAAHPVERQHAGVS